MLGCKGASAAAGIPSHGSRACVFSQNPSKAEQESPRKVERDGRSISIPTHQHRYDALIMVCGADRESLSGQKNPTKKESKFAGRKDDEAVHDDSEAGIAASERASKARGMDGSVRITLEPSTQGDVRTRGSALLRRDAMTPCDALRRLSASTAPVVFSLGWPARRGPAETPNAPRRQRGSMRRAVLAELERRRQLRRWYCWSSGYVGCLDAASLSLSHLGLAVAVYFTVHTVTNGPLAPKFTETTPVYLDFVLPYGNVSPPLFSRQTVLQC